MHIPVAVSVPRRPSFNDLARSHFNSPASPLCYRGGVGGLRATTVRDSKGSVLRCNLTASFLGSPLSVSMLLPWLPVKSLLYLFVPKFCPPPPVTLALARGEMSTLVAQILARSVTSLGVR